MDKAHTIGLITRMNTQETKKQKIMKLRTQRNYTETKNTMNQ